MLYQKNKNGGIFFSISIHLRLHISIAKFLNKKEFLYLTIFCIFLIYYRRLFFILQLKLKLKLLKSIEFQFESNLRI